jgi:prepilin-type N-terminal cleavage/methylation domain-containing protein
VTSCELLLPGYTLERERKDRSSGFTLLEVLVALAIVGMAITAILQLFSSNLRAISASEDHVRASLRAEARMREIIDSEALVEKVWTETTNDGYRVDVAVSSVQTERARVIGAALFQVDLSLSWRRGVKNRTISLKTLKLVRPGDVTKGGVPS